MTHAAVGAPRPILHPCRAFGVKVRLSYEAA